MTRDVIGAVLGGGRGRRIGGDKASLEVGGRTLADRAVDVLRSLELDVALVLRAGQPAPVADAEVAVVRDLVEDAGPLGGIQALLEWLTAEWALVLACDQPFVKPALLRGLLEQPRDDVDAVVGRPGQEREPLPGLYRRTALQPVSDALSHGDRSLHELVASLRVREVPGDALRRWDTDLLSFANVNTQEDLAWARGYAERGEQA